MTNRETLISAALRHTRDAEALLVDSPDQAWHLAGFGPECARKACLTVRWADMAIGHDFGTASAEVIDFALALDPVASRFRPQRALPPSLGPWGPEARYVETGHFDLAQVHTLVQEARAWVDEVVLDLYLSGELAEEALQ